MEHARRASTICGVHACSGSDVGARLLMVSGLSSECEVQGIDNA